jgi:hypothetical protein
LHSNERIKEASERLLKIFDTKSSEKEQTVLFSDHDAANHDQLCKAFEYWLDQTKMVFGEIVSLIQNQGLRDSGVDLLLDFPLSRIHFGVQVKSYNDIQKGDFSQKVNSQINQSHRHDLVKLIVAFAGDLTNMSQLEKVRGIISEINEQQKSGNNYVFIIPPEKVLTLYNAYKSKEHPLKHVMLENKDAITFAKGIEDNLSNERRKAKVKIEIEYQYPDATENCPYKIELRYKVDQHDLDLIDNIEHLPLTQDYVKLTEDQIKSFNTYDKDGNIISIDRPKELFIWADHNPIVVLNMSTIAKNGDEIASMNKVVFGIKRQNYALHFKTKDENQPLELELIFFVDKNVLRLIVNINYDKGDAIVLLNCIKFLQSFNKAKKLKYFNCNTGETDFFDLPATFNFQIHPLLLDFVSSLAILQRHTGKLFRLPEKLEDDLFIKIVDTTKILSKLLETKSYFYRPVKFKMPKTLALKMIEDYMNQIIEYDLVINLPFSCIILGQEVRVAEATLDLSKVKPLGDLIQLFTTIKKNQENLVEIEMVDS